MNKEGRKFYSDKRNCVCAFSDSFYTHTNTHIPCVYNIPVYTRPSLVRESSSIISAGRRLRSVVDKNKMDLGVLFLSPSMCVCVCVCVYIHPTENPEMKRQEALVTDRPKKTRTLKYVYTFLFSFRVPQTH